MIALAPLFCIIIAYFAGEAITFVLRDKRRTVPEKCLLGTFFLLISWELFALPGIRMRASFDYISSLYTGFMLLVMAGAFLASYKRYTEFGLIKGEIRYLSVIAVIIIIALQVVCIFCIQPDTSGDFSAETINVTLTNDSMYEINPMTGREFLSGMTFRGKMVTLPLFYAYIAKLFGYDSITTAYRVIPVWGLYLNMIVYYLWACMLFPDKNKNNNSKTMFLLGVGVLNIAGLFSKNSLFYCILLRGFRGETICYALVVPFIAYACFEAWKHKDYYMYVYVVMALASTCVLADIQVGLMSCAMSLLLCLLIALGYRIRRWIGVRSIR